MDGFVAEPGDVMPDPDERPSSGPLWDDDAFVARVKRIARTKRMTLVAVAKAAGVSEAWLRHGAKNTGRAVDYILRVAQVLEVDAAELMGLKPLSQPLGQVSTRGGDSRRLAMVSSIAAHLYAALDEVGTQGDARLALTTICAFIDHPDESGK